MQATLGLDLPAPSPQDRRTRHAARRHRESLCAPRICAGATALGTWTYLEGAAGQEELDALCERIAAGGRPLVVDLETTGLDPHTDRILLASFTTDGDHAWVFSPERLDPAAFIEVLRANPIMGQNLKFDWKFWKRHWDVEATIAWDTMVTHGVALAGLSHTAGGNGLAAMARRYLGVALEKGSREAFYQSGVWRTAEQIAYAGDDALATYRLVAVTRLLLARSGQEAVWTRFEQPLIPVLARMELAGVRVDLGRIRAAREAYAAKLVRAEAALGALAPGVNYNSFDQIKGFFVEALGAENLPYKKDKKTGEARVSFDKFSLALINHPVARAILDCRDYSKVLSAFLIPWGEGQYNRRTGCIHCSYTQVDTDTGRMSARAPNLQQTPAEPEFRSIFVPGPGRAMVCADYSQFELRILAEESGDEEMAGVFHRRLALQAEHARRVAAGEPPDGAPLADLARRIGLSDHHCQTALLMFDLDIGDFEGPDDPAFRKWRKAAKCISFGIPYQLGPRALAANIGKSLEETRALLDRYFALYTRVKGWIERQKARALTPVEGHGRRMGFPHQILSATETLGGRRRHYAVPRAQSLESRDPDVAEQARSARAAIQRQGVNQPVQGLNADVTKLALIRLDREFRARYPEAVIHLAIHDEIVSSCPIAQAEEVAELQRAVMVWAGEQFLRSVPTEVSLDIADCWQK